jgi:hypothetical protein
MKPDPIITAFGPVANPRGNVIRLHRPTTIELSYARQGKAFRPDPIDLYPAEKCRWGDRQRKGSMVSLLLPRSYGGGGVWRREDRALAGVPDTHPIDLRVNQLKLRVHPPIAWWEVVTMMLAAAFIGVLLATGGAL